MAVGFWTMVVGLIDIVILFGSSVSVTMFEMGTLGPVVVLLKSQNCCVSGWQEAGSKVYPSGGVPPLQLLAKGKKKKRAPDGAQQSGLPVEQYSPVTVLQSRQSVCQFTLPQSQLSNR